MKKLLTTLIAALMCVVLFCSISACNKTPEDIGEATDSVSESVTDTASKSSGPRKSTPYTPATEKVLGNNTGAENTTIYFVGDSTVCTYKEADDTNHYYKRYGYGSVFQSLVTEKATVKNLALSGRSSKDFLTRKEYTELTENIKAGDYLIIGFGHNDAKTDDARYTNPMGPVTEEGSFKKVLYDNYVKLAIDRGATPILCTPIVRRSSSGTYTGTNIHQTTSTIKYEGGDYTNAIVELGDEFGVTVINLTEITKNLLTGKDDSESGKYYAWSSYNAETNTRGVDNTHLNQYGANEVARIICNEIKASDNTLKNYILETLPTFTFEDMKPNVPAA